MPGYATVCRYMKHHGLLRASKKRQRDEAAPFAQRETRSFEVSHVHGLWHLDFHEGSRAVLSSDGEWRKPQLLGILDDRSRLCCHLQWYWTETAEVLVHGLSQAFHKRGIESTSRRLGKLVGDNAVVTPVLDRLLHHGMQSSTDLAADASPESNGLAECLIKGFKTDCA